jgi:hypothetical protein
MSDISFSPLEESVSFYTRNDFAILNRLLVGDYDGLWKYAELAYNDNRGIIDEYARGEREICGEYDVKWLASLKKRVIDGINEETKRIILGNARQDIANLLGAMQPSERKLRLYRTAWLDTNAPQNTYAYSREYPALELAADAVLELKTISSYSMTPYREDDDVGSDFYRYELSVPRGAPVLELDKFACHNEDGEVLLPPMRCRVTEIIRGERKNCRAVIRLEYVERINIK